MAVLLGVIIILLVALVLVATERSQPYPPVGGGHIVGFPVNAEQMRGLGAGDWGRGCVVILAITGLVTIVGGFVLVASSL